VTEPPASDMHPVLDPMLSRALRVESMVPDELHIIETGTGDVAPTSPLPMAPVPPPVSDEHPDDRVALAEQSKAAVAAGRVEAQLDAAAASEVAEPAEGSSMDGILQAALEAKAMAAAKADAQQRMRDAMEKAKVAAAERVRRSAAGAKKMGSAQGKATNVVSFLSDHHSSRASGGSCVDKHSSCPHWARVGECSINQAYMHRSCAASCGVCERRQEASVTAPAEPASADSEPTTEADAWKCVDEHPRCAQWAKALECERNPGFMHSDCPVSCGSCETAERMSRLRVAAGLPA